MQNVTQTAREEYRHALVDVRRRHVLPLLQLDDHRTRTIVVAHPRRHALEALRAQRQLPLEQHAVVDEVARLQRRRRRPQRLLPRLHLRLPRLEPVVVEQRLLHHRGHAVLRRVGDEVGARSAVVDAPLSCFTAFADLGRHALRSSQTTASVCRRGYLFRR